jgi:hypothetical protein
VCIYHTVPCPNGLSCVVLYCVVPQCTLLLQCHTLICCTTTYTLCCTTTLYIVLHYTLCCTIHCAALLHYTLCCTMLNVVSHYSVLFFTVLYGAIVIELWYTALRHIPHCAPIICVILNCTVLLCT